MAINLRLPDRLHADIATAAAAEGVSINTFIVKAMRSHLRRQLGFGYEPTPDRARLNRELIDAARRIVKASEAAGS
ncbi:YlcI/YnfO family protein [Nevskia sp.]|uniref:YlcI/YnfO family protein n=1 Tax=Nevskia sp. TaxID=1929292 RepID=UPI0025F05B05|nr:YlcI/YnfO family protein [Nevskia sp.]